MCVFVCCLIIVWCWHSSFKRRSFLYFHFKTCHCHNTKNVKLMVLDAEATTWKMMCFCCFLLSSNFNSWIQVPCSEEAQDTRTGSVLLLWSTLTFRSAPNVRSETSRMGSVPYKRCLTGFCVLFWFGFLPLPPA